MNRIDFIRGEIRRSIHGPAWHGPALLEALHGVTPEVALASRNGAHSVAQIAIHTVAWMEEVARRLNGSAPAYPERGDWSTDPHATSDAWSRIEELVAAAERALDRMLRDMAPERLDEKVGGPDLDAATGAGVTYEVMLHGVVQHNSYHGGQISLLRKMAS